jgi:4-hydroxybenzoate polyprenyltransferase
MALNDKVFNYALLMRFDRPIGIYLLMWPALWALWIASEGSPDTWVLIVFILGVILMRAGGCVINDYADRNFDGKVTRTKSRPLVSGLVTPREARWLFICLSVIAFFIVLTLNSLTVTLACIAMVLAIIYPFTKRYTYMPQAFLGLAFGWAVPMAFAAQTNQIPEVAWLLLTATVLWATAYDTMYAMVDREDDIRIGIKSTAILFGDADRLIITMIQLLFVITMWIVGNRLDMGMYYYLGLLAAICLGIYQQFLIMDRKPDKCLRAFLNNSLFGGAIFAGIVLHYMTTGQPAAG